MRFDDLLRDIRHAARGLRRTPGFAVAVVLTLALGVGGNTAIFSVVDQVLLRPLPYPDGERLVRIYERNLTARTPDARFSNGVSPANWLDWQARSKTLSSIGIWFNMSRTLTGQGEPQQLNGQFVSWEFLQTLGVTPFLGRTLTADDDRRNAPRAAILSYGLWVRRFGANPDVVGRVIQLDDAPVTIVGDVPNGSVRGQASPTVYYSQRQMPEQGMSFLIRTTQPEALSRRAVEALHGIDANLAVTFVRTLETAMSESIARERLNALVSTSFGLSGLLLAALGLYGLLAFLVTERTKEIGIRISLGAPLARVTAAVVGSGLRLVAMGTLVGVVASLLLGRWLESLLFGVSPYDATTYLVALALISVVAGVASYVPARRAAGVEPLAALRQE
jgi:hypothetical protein